MKERLTQRLQAAHGFVAAACALSLGVLYVSIDRAQSSADDALASARYTRDVQMAAVSCRGYLEMVLHRPRDAGREAAGQRAASRLTRSSGYAWQAGSVADSEELARMARFIKAAQTLLDRMADLDRRGKRSEAAALYRKGVRPLIEQYLAASLRRQLEDDSARRAGIQDEAGRWLALSFAAAASSIALAFLLLFLWTRRLGAYWDRSLGRLRDAMGVVASGNLDVALKAERDDELGALTANFSAMAIHLAQAQGRLLETERQAAFAQLAGGAAHALNNPLSAVIGYASLLLEQSPPESPARRDLLMIQEQANRCDAILRSLRQFAQAKDVPDEPTQINDLLRGMAELLRPSMESASIWLSVRLDESMPEIAAKPQQLQQVFYSLILNAMQAVRGRPGAQITIRTHRDGPWACVFVADNGEGISPENLTRIFEPFFTTRDPGEGAGLGLSSALTVVRAHGGEILVDSSPGTGARFEVRLQARAAPPRENPAPAASSGRVLVVDDERVFLDFVDGVLGREGFEVVCVSDANAALRAIESSRYDLILSDYRIPGLEASEFFAELQRRRPKRTERFLFSAGDSVPDDLRAFAALNGIDVLSKPIDPAQLVRTVRSRVGREPN